MSTTLITLQDGSDAAVPASQTAEKKGNVTRALLLILFDSFGTPTESQLVPMTQTYEGAVQLVLSVFDRALRKNIDEADVILKYPCKRMTGTTMWAGLRAAQGSAEVWARLVDGPDVVEIGVFIPFKDLAVNPAAESSIVNDRDVPIRVKFAGSNHPDASKELFFLPPTYEDLLKEAARFVDRYGLSGQILGQRVYHDRLRLYIENAMLIHQLSYPSQVSAWARNNSGSETNDIVDIHIHYQ